MQLLRYSRFLFQNSSSLQKCGNNSSISRQFITFTEIRMYSSWLRNFNRGARVQFKSENCKNKFFNASYANILLFSFKETLKRMPVVLKGHSMNIVKHCAEQCEFIIAHRIRRSQQIISLYTKLWDEMALKQFVIKLRRKLIKKGKYMLLSSAAVYNWEEERITNEEIARYENEMHVIKELKAKQYCRQSKEGEKCQCFNCLTPSEQQWAVFVNEANLTVWKKEETSHIGEGLYCYKLYGRYEDVTALDFLEAQVDLDYRISWDPLAVTLRTIDTERSTRSDVIYWETKWPTPFSNRDYVFKRRYHIDRKRKLATLVNHITEHPSCPVYAGKQRVKEYWSYMVIQPTEDLDKPGLEFSLTYFDNPGVSVPSKISSYATVTGMPSFLKNLHDAAKSLNDKRTGPSILDDDDDRKSSGKDRRRKPPSPSSDDDSPTEPKKNTKCPKLPDMTNFERICDSYFLF